MSRPMIPRCHFASIGQDVTPVPSNTVYIPVMSSEVQNVTTLPYRATPQSIPSGVLGSTITSPQVYWQQQAVVSQVDSAHEAGNDTIPITNSVQNPEKISSVNEELAINVSHSIKEKVIKGEYVDLSLLLNNSVNPAIGKQKLVWEQGELMLQATTQQQKISNIELWTDAFILFMHIYCSVHKSRFQELLKYMHSVRLGAKRSQPLGWKYYDEQYRLKKALDPTSSWSVMDTELWILYMQSRPLQMESVAQFKGPGFGSSGLYTQISGQILKCYNYNYSGVCTRVPCQYQHSCLRCHALHPVIICNRQFEGSRPNVHVGAINAPRNQFRPPVFEGHRVRIFPQNVQSRNEKYRGRPRYRPLGGWQNPH